MVVVVAVVAVVAGDLVVAVVAVAAGCCWRFIAIWSTKVMSDTHGCYYLLC